MLYFAHLSELLVLKSTLVGSRVRCEQRMLCACGQILLQMKYFSGIFQGCNRKRGVATPPHSLQIQLVLGWFLKALEGGEECGGGSRGVQCRLEKRIPLW